MLELVGHRMEDEELGMGGIGKCDSSAEGWATQDTKLREDG